jgi:YrhK-like protein
MSHPPVTARGVAAIHTNSTWHLPDGWIRISSQRWGPFVIRELVRRPDGQIVELTARRHRKGHGPAVTDTANPARAHAVVWAPRDLGWWVAALFIVGSACFAIGSAPMLSSVASAKLISSIYFIGSLFFTSAGYLQYLQAINARGTGEQPAIHRWFGTMPHSLGWWAAAVQLAGTVFFNVTTFAGLHTGFTVHQQNLRIWSPDFFGSICFLVASWFAIEEIRMPEVRRRWRWSEIPWRIVWLNMIGSIFFMASAIAAFVRPATNELLSASIANGGTFLGAVCFFLGAWLLLVELGIATTYEPSVRTAH